MIVYWGMFLWVFLIGFFQPDEKNPLKSNEAGAYRATWGMAVALMLPIVFFAALRTAPIDTQNYIRIFNNIPQDMDLFDEWILTCTDSQLYYAIQMMFKCYISNDATMWLTFIATIQGVLMMYTLQKYSVNIAMSVYIFMGSTMFTWMYNGIRQFLVVTILFALTDCIIKNKWYIYVPVALVLSGVAPLCEILGWEEPVWFLGGFHQSALMMIPVFFFVQGKAWNWKMLVFIAAFVLLLLSGGLDGFLESATETTAYSQDMQYVEEDTGAHPLRAIVPLVPVVMALMKRKELRAMTDLPPLVAVSINMSVITVALYVASVFTSGLFVGRLPVYTEVYNLLLLPWLIMNPFKRDKQLIAYGLYAAYFFWFVYQMHLAWGGLSYASEDLGIALYGGTW